MHGFWAGQAHAPTNSPQTGDFRRKDVGLFSPTLPERNACAIMAKKGGQRRNQSQLLPQRIETMSSKQPQQSQMQMSFPLSLAPSMQDMLASATLAMNEAVAARRAAGQETIH